MTSLEQPLGAAMLLSEEGSPVGLSKYPKRFDVRLQFALGFGETNFHFVAPRSLPDKRFRAPITSLGIVTCDFAIRQPRAASSRPICISYPSPAASLNTWSCRGPHNDATLVEDQSPTRISGSPSMPSARRSSRAQSAKSRYRRTGAFSRWQDRLLAIRFEPQLCHPRR